MHEESPAERAVAPTRSGLGPATSSKSLLEEGESGLLGLAVYCQLLKLLLDGVEHSDNVGQVVGVLVTVCEVVAVVAVGPVSAGYRLSTAQAGHNENLGARLRGPLCMKR